jgi:hypothetical protein
MEASRNDMRPAADFKPEDSKRGTIKVPVTLIRLNHSSRITLGVYKGNGCETLRGYVTVPIRSTDKVVMGIRGYKIDRHAQGASIVVVGTPEIRGNG